MDEQEHDIIVHFNNSIFTINRVDPDSYCCMDMVTDVAEVTNVFMGDSLSKIVEGDDAPNVSYEYNDDTINTQLDENSDDGFLDYQSGDEGYVSSTDFEEIEAEVDETRRRGRKRKCNVGDTSRFEVEFNVPED
ncbi:unnamed protein product [Ilex paraguariensis]|uniref:Uncharacterized protein n=1 Tax=Ilex paraguariensis TaxID=185542 RepID=A0ABC8RSD1_9AQUA